jgi:23S rRNA (guanosine2251-2'-O)-methyltransferase
VNRFIYGANPVFEAVRAHPREIVRVLVERGHDGRPSQGAERVVRAAHEAGVRVEDAPRGELQRGSSGGAHQGIGAELSEFHYAELEDLLHTGAAKPFLVVLDGVTDPQNLGALARSAQALGAHGLILPKDRSAGVTPAAFKAAAGALERFPVARVTNLSRTLEDLEEKGVWTVALAADGDRDISQIDLTTGIAIVLGSEGKGVRPLVRRSCDHVARIPMQGGVGSLNVSAAGAIAFYEVARQRAAR